MTPTCIVCGEDVDPLSEFVQTWHDRDRGGWAWFVHAAHSQGSVHDAMVRSRAEGTPGPDRDYWPIERAHPYDPEYERNAAAQAKSDAQTATLIAGKTRASRVVHDLAPSDDPTAILDMPDPLAEPARGGWIPNRPAGFERLAALGAALMDQWDRSGLAVHHIDGNPRNNAPDNLAIVARRQVASVAFTIPADQVDPEFLAMLTGEPVSRGGMTDDDYARFVDHTTP